MPTRKPGVLSMLMAAVFQVAVALGGETPSAIGIDGARHLLSRAAFAASEAEIRTLAPLSRGEAADRLLSTTGVAITPLPAWVNDSPIPPAVLQKMTVEERQAELRRNAERAFQLREWWFREMLDTPSPLTEKMTLFWHNHFATSQQKVRFTPLIYQQNEILRRNALGNFRNMLHEIARNPAMLIYLDGANSRKEQPNENFAREVMELFTLGEGHYTERDIKEAARAFTGWSVDRESGKFVFRRGIHDYGRKSVLGKTGFLDGDQVLDILLAQPQTARFITAKLWKEFISSNPDPVEVERLAQIFRDSGYNIGKLMRAMLISDAFYAMENRAALIKSPVEFVVGTLKTFGIETPNLRPFVLASALLGQNLFAPPNVKGWPGGEAWINSASLLGRKQLIDRLFRNEDRIDVAMRDIDAMAVRNGDLEAPGSVARRQRAMERQMGGIRWNLDKWSSSFTDSSSQSGQDQMARVVLAMAPQRAVPASSSAADWARQLVADPAYQLK